MGHKYAKDELLARSLEVALDDGLSAITFGRLATRLEVSDRMLVYYFRSKDQLVTELVLTMGLQLQTTLGAAFESGAGAGAADHRSLVRAAWPVLGDGSADRVFAVFFEANGLAAAGHEPYASLVPQLVEAWVEWVTTFLEGDGDRRRAEAEAAIAVVDGLLLLRLLAGGAAADRAAERLGIT